MSLDPRRPVPLQETALDTRAYGGALMPGEGEAIAGFVQAGMRIPRRGKCAARTTPKPLARNYKGHTRQQVKSE
jgi:hypothetical protein